MNLTLGVEPILDPFVKLFGVIDQGIAYPTELRSDPFLANALHDHQTQAKELSRSLLRHVAIDQISGLHEEVQGIHFVEKLTPNPSPLGACATLAVGNENARGQTRLGSNITCADELRHLALQWDTGPCLLLYASTEILKNFTLQFYQTEYYTSIIGAYPCLEVLMILAKVNCQTALAKDASGKLFFLDLTEPWLAKEVGSDPPDEEEDHSVYWPIKTPQLLFRRINEYPRIPLAG